MTDAIILAIDEGTTNAKAACVNHGGQIISVGSQALNLHHPQPAWSEQDPEEIIRAVATAVDTALVGANNPTIEAVAISNQRESILLWNRDTGKAISPVITWQCRRSSAFCQTLANSEHAKTVQSKTGLPIDPLFPAAKITWLLDNIPDARALADKNQLCAGTIDSWLVWRLTAGRVFVTDHSNASRTQLFNIHEQRWDDSLLEVFSIPRSCLADILPSSGLRGNTSGFTSIPDGVPIFSQIGDSHSALYGQGGFIPGMIKATYGTGSSLMTPVTTISGNDYRLSHTVAWHDSELSYALEGNVTHTGSGVAWMSQALGVNDSSKLAAMANSTDNNQGVYFVPALSGLGAPHWKPEARGLITGLTANTTPALLARAALESIAYQIADVFFLMETMSGDSLTSLLVDGGPAQNDWLMQFQANLLERPIVRSRTAEVSALGAAYLAGKALGWWQTRMDLTHLERHSDVIRPQEHIDLSSDYDGWKAAVDRAL